MLEYTILMFLKQRHLIKPSIFRGVYDDDDIKSSSHVFHLLKVVSRRASGVSPYQFVFSDFLCTCVINFKVKATKL